MRKREAFFDRFSPTWRNVPNYTKASEVLFFTHLGWRSLYFSMATREKTSTSSAYTAGKAGFLAMMTS
jgi:hypothetical protein